MKLGVMGAHGSFSEQAGELYEPDAEIIPLVSADKVLQALEAGDIDRAVFPIENSTAGVVIEAVHAMAKYKFIVERMFELEVNHMLLVKPGTKPSCITAISSHDQALKQCRIYIKRTWPKADILPYADTAKAASDLAEGVLLRNTAVIAPLRCAEMYGLEVMEESIQDMKYNHTTFIVAAKAAS